MAEDPFQRVRDAPLFIVPRTLDALRAFRDEPGLDDDLARVADRLLAGLAAHPTKFWVLKQYQQVVIWARSSASSAARAACWLSSPESGG
ncbi:hypothetical protein GCM10025794_25380 [Massilia kyonggiensis]